jgi:hypothetical protein
MRVGAGMDQFDPCSQYTNTDLSNVCMILSIVLYLSFVAKIYG